MRELMPEMWWREEEEVARSTLTWPQCKVGPVTDILQWLSCYAAVVGMLSRAYPQMVPELMAYQATIIKCCHDFEGLAWAQYDQVYQRQAAQTKDLHWSWLNPNFYSLFRWKGKKTRGMQFLSSFLQAREQVTLSLQSKPPQPLLDMLINDKLDWTSPARRGMFRDTLKMA